ncbi:putative methyltransferase [Pelodytes ibericus]
MATRLFEGKEHASAYQKYRFSPPQEIQDMIFNYMDKRLMKPYTLAVDVGCGTGQSTRILVPNFQKVLGADISEAQIEEAKKADVSPNVTYSVSPAEELPVEDASVDLVTASAAVHWFNTEKFLKEVNRILKPGGCLALFTYMLDMEVHYKDQSEQLTKAVSEVQDKLSPYLNKRVNQCKSGYKDIFEAIPYTDKQRLDKIVIKTPMTVADFWGFYQTLTMYQIYLKLEPEKAKELIDTAEQRFLEIMGVSSIETQVEIWLSNVCVLASKPK